MNKEFLTPDEIQLINSFRRLTPDDQDHVMDLLGRYENGKITVEELVDIMNKEMGK